MKEIALSNLKIIRIKDKIEQCYLKMFLKVPET